MPIATRPTRSFALITILGVALAAAGSPLVAMIDFTWSPSQPVAGQTITFTGEFADGVFGTTAWDFGEGAPAAQGPATTTHVYQSPGSYQVTFFVGGPSNSITKTVVVRAPLADFDFSPAGPDIGEVVTFTDRSNGQPTSRTWMFGDGTMGAGANVTHAYGAPGTYEVTLQISYDAGETAELSPSVTKQVVVTAPTPLEASFTVSPPPLRVGETITFTDTSSGGPVSHMWTFGDGVASNAASATHVYSSSGTYTVTLTIGAPGQGTDQATQTITVLPALAASFVFAPIDPKAGQGVRFTDTSQGSPIVWTWDFGDGASSSAQNPIHAFGAPGEYLVTLTISTGLASGDPAETSTTMQTVVVEPPGIDADFEVKPPRPEVGEPVQLVDRSTGSILQWQWTFGDGAGSSQRSPIHSFDTPGNYDVTLTVRAAAKQQDSVTKTVQVVPVGSVSAAFDFQPQDALAGEIVSFFNNSSGTIESVSWTFGDGETSSANAPTHVFRQAGTFDVTLTVRGESSQDSLTRSVTITQPASEVAFTAFAFDAAEPDGQVIVEVARTGSVSGAAEVEVEVTDSSATRGEDFEIDRQPVLRWADGEGGIQQFAVGLIDDDLVERSETVGLALRAVSATVRIGSPGEARIVIENDDFEQRPDIRLDSAADVALRPAVASFVPDGRTPERRRQVIVWEADTPQGRRIRAQLFGPDGTVLGSPFDVSASAAGGQSEPSVEFDGRGNFAVVWRTTADAAASTALVAGRSAAAQVTTGVQGRMFSVEGDPLSELDLELSTPATPPESRPEVSSDSGGDVTVSWETPDGKSVGVAVPSGSSEPLPPFEISAAGSSPQIAQTPTGGLVAVWREEGVSQLLRAGGRAARGAVVTGIVARQFAPDGEPQGSAVTVVADPTADNPAIAVNGEGDFVIVWETDNGPDADVMAQLFDEQAAPSGPPIALSTAPGDQRKPRVDMNAAGDFAAVWESDTGVREVEARLFDRAGKAAGAAFSVAAEAAGDPPSNPDVTIDDADQVRVAFDRPGAGGVFTQVFEAGITEPCIEDGRSLCLQDERFQIRVDWRAPDGTSGIGNAVQLTGDTGYFWFFEPTNIELVFKVLDACSFNQRFWVFGGGLTDVEASVTVTDTATGQTRLYGSPGGAPFAPIQDTNALTGCDLGSGAAAVVSSLPAGADPEADSIGALLLREAAGATAKLASAARARTASAASACTTAGTELCLNNGRFLVEADWNSGAEAGIAQAVQLTSDTGYVYFFDPDNVELVVKVLDACILNDSFWVFAGGLTDVGVNLTITDLATGAVREYTSRLGTPFQPVLDTGAFAACQ